MTESVFIHISDLLDMFSLQHLRSRLDSTLTITTGKTIPHPEKLSFLVSGRPDRETLTRCPNLMGVIVPFAGVPETTQALMADYPHITLHNLHHNALPVVENTLALLLAAAKHIIPPHNALRDNDWRPRYGENPSILLRGKTALLLGYGQIGSRLAKVLSAFDMHIMAIRNVIASSVTDDFAEIHPTGELRTLLPRADVLINTLPLTPATENLIGKREFALLPAGAIVVNVGRGKVIDQRAFYHALKSGHLGAAAIDVWYHYPEDEASQRDTPPADYPFGEMENVVLSPHRAGGLNTPDTERLRMEHLADLLNLAARGQALPNQVDPNRGY